MHHSCTSITESDCLNSQKPSSLENAKKSTRSQSCSIPASISSKNPHRFPKWSLNAEYNVINLDDVDSKPKPKTSWTASPRRRKSQSSKNLDQSRTRRLSKYLSKQRKSIAAIGSDMISECSLESARNFLKLASKTGVNEDHSSDELNEKEELHTEGKNNSSGILEDTLKYPNTCSPTYKVRNRALSNLSHKRDSLPNINLVNRNECNIEKETPRKQGTYNDSKLKEIKSEEGSLPVRRYEGISTDHNGVNLKIYKSSLSHAQPFDYFCKVVLLGDSGVGKTCLLMKYKDGAFLSGSYISTVGIDFRNKFINIDDFKVKLQIWDTAGQERFRSITYSYYRDAHALLLLYDVTSKPTFDNTREWLTEVHEYAQDDVIIMLIGNKCDVPLSERQIRREDGERLAKEYKVAFMETSSKTGLNVDLAFTAVARDLIERKSSNNLGKRFNVSEYVQKQEKFDNCVCNIG